MLSDTPIVASKTVTGKTVRAEFYSSNGRLRILVGTTIWMEWLPPHSWFVIASASGHSRWGTKPDQTDLLLLIDNLMDAL